jgi:hypothetical protein
VEPTPAPNPARLLDEDGQIAADLSCIQCEYNLRTLHEAGVCPECGRQVADSLEWCQGISSEWLGNTASSLKAFAALLTVAAGLAAAGLVMDICAPKAAAPGALFFAILFGLLVFLLLLLALIGMTVRDPRLGGSHEGLSARRGVRMLLLAIPASLALAAFAATAASEALSWLMVVSYAVLIPTMGLRHIANLMQGIRRPDLATTASRLLWLTLPFGRGPVAPKRVTRVILEFLKMEM